MKNENGVLALGAAFLLLAASAAPAETTIKGTVVDADGKPVAGADVGTNWDLGMDAKPYDGVKTADDGTFALTLKYYSPPAALLAMDAARGTGAAVVVASDDAAKPQTLRLAPLVPVKGEFACTDETVSIAGISIQWQVGKARAGNLYTTETKWSAKLPPGAWSFWTFNNDLAPFARDFDIGADAKDVDLGTMKIAPATLTTLQGKPFPDWKVSAARGVDKAVQPKDYKGKWLLVEFWGFW